MRRDTASPVGEAVVPLEKAQVSGVPSFQSGLASIRRHLEDPPRDPVERLGAQV
jgi:hypothetical protein